MTSQVQSMKQTSMFPEALVFAQPLWEFLFAARLELIAFVSAMLLYSLLFSKRISKKDLLRQKIKSLDEPPCVPSPRSQNDADKVVEKKATNSPKVRPTAHKSSAHASRGADVARHIVMIRKCASEKNLKGAMNIFDSLKASGVEMNSVVYNTVLDACVKCRDWKAAHAWMEETRKAGLIDVVSYNTLMKAHLLNNDLDKARGIVREMKQAGMQPNRVTFNELINAAVARGGENNVIWDIVKEMREMGMPPNQVTCSILLKSLTAYSSASEVENVMDLVSTIDEPMDEVLMSSMVEACVRIGKPDLLTSKLEHLEKSNKLTVSNSHTFGSLIKAYGHARDLPAVWRCWKEMRGRLIKPTAITLGCMIEAIVSNGCTEDAYELITQLQCDSQCKDSVNAIIYCSILKGFTREKRLQRVWAVYEEMRQKKLEMSLVTFNTVIDACARVSRMDDASKVMDDMKLFRVEPNIITYSTLLKGHCQAGNIEYAFDTLQQMRMETNLKPDEIMYNSLLDGCAQNSLYPEGMQVYEEMLQQGVRPSNFTLSILVKLMNRSKRVDEAFAIVQTITKNYGVKPNAHVYTNLIQACVSNRRHARALTVLETMVKERVPLDSRVYGVLIRASVFQSQYQQAAGLLRGALGLPGALEMLSDAHYATCTTFDNNLVNETLSKLAECGCTETLVAPLLADLKKSRHRVHVDPALQRKVTTSNMAKVADAVASSSGKGKGRGAYS